MFALVAIPASQALAQQGQATTMRLVGVAAGTPGSTFAVTSYADLPAATLTFTPQFSPTETNAPGTPVRPQYIIVDWSADVSKATGTSGNCSVYANGAVIAASSRSSHFSAGINSIGGRYTVANSVNGAQTVKLQCRSADTSVFTVNTAQMTVTLAR